MTVLVPAFAAFVAVQIAAIQRVLGNPEHELLAFAAGVVFAGAAVIALAREML